METVTFTSKNSTPKTVSGLGFGCMSLVPDAYKPKEGERVDDPREVLKKAYHLGMRFWDTADMYAEGASEKLLGTMWDDVPREEIVLASKCGIVRDPANPRVRNVNNSAEYVVEACEASLKRLQTDYLDIFYLHRKDLNVDIEVPMKGFKELVEQEKIHHIGLCEVDAETLRRAHAIHPVSVVQIEYSLLTRGPALGLIDTCRELGIKIVAYSPISRGLLSGAVNSSFAEGDTRQTMPRFIGENKERNLEIVKKIAAIAERKGCSVPQLCLAYLLHQPDCVIPIPGTKSIRHLQSNAEAMKVKLTKADIEALEAAAPVDAASGARYQEGAMKQFALKY